MCWGKVAPCAIQYRAPKTYGDLDITAPRVSNPGSRWKKCVVSFKFRPLYPRGEIARYSMDRKMDGPYARSGCDDVNNYRPCRESNFGYAGNPAYVSDSIHNLIT
jgi:hypothetical protein